MRPKINEIKNAVKHLDNENDECSMESDDSILNDYVLLLHSPETIIVEKKILNDEDNATENWTRKNKNKIKSYPSPNPHLKHLDFNSKKISRFLPVLKSGSRAEDLKALQIKGYGKIVLTNTCSFDTVVSLIMVAMCDSNRYLKSIDETQICSTFIELIRNILSKSIAIRIAKGQKL